MRHWSKAHALEEEEVEVVHRGCCMRMLRSCCNCAKCIVCLPFILFRTCTTWMFCPKSTNDHQDAFGITYKEYRAWTEKEDIGTREIPYKRLGTQNYFFAAIDEDDRFEDEEQRKRKRFSSADFMVKDLRLRTEDQMELAYMQDTEEAVKEEEEEEDGAGGDVSDGGKDAEEAGGGDETNGHSTNETVILKVDGVAGDEDENEEEDLIVGQDETGNVGVNGTDSEETQQ